MCSSSGSLTVQAKSLHPLVNTFNLTVSLPVVQGSVMKASAVAPTAGEASTAGPATATRFHAQTGSQRKRVAIRGISMD